MIQEKDFLYRVPVKTAPITTPRGQIRNPEILVDVEGGEFMHGNILDANSTNKLINQSVKDAVDNKLNESGYVTKDLLEAETTRATEQENSLKTLISAETGARTKGDEDLSSKIKAEQTRAEGKEKEISDKLAIVDGDSNTEGSFRKAIADVVAAAPEDLDTLKEIADKLAGNDDLHTALNQAITEKADTAALINEVTRATNAESSLQAAIDTNWGKVKDHVKTSIDSQQFKTINGTSVKGAGDIHIDLTLYKVVSALPTSGRSTTKIYLVKDSSVDGNLYSEYMYVDEKWEKLGSFRSSVDLEPYAKTDYVNAQLATKVDKQSGKGLSTNDFTTAEKNKLENISAGANNYSLPLATSNVRGGAKIGYTTNSSNRNYAVQLSNEQMYVNVPWTDTNTTYSLATSTNNGLMSASDKTKLDSITTITDTELKSILV